MNTKDQNTEEQNASMLKRRRRIELSFMMGVTGFSTLLGFGYAIALAKKQDPGMFTKGLINPKSIPDSGGALAVKALGWGTLYAVGGVALLSFSIWKLMGVRNMDEFRNKVQNTLPRIPKKETQEKSDFKTVKELVDYITNNGK